MAANVVNTNIKDTTYESFICFRVGFSLFLAFLITKINFSLVKRIIEFYIFV
jgi:hypothetical protein